MILPLREEGTTGLVAARRFQASDEVRPDPGDVAMRLPYTEGIGGDLDSGVLLSQRAGCT